MAFPPTVLDFVVRWITGFLFHLMELEEGSGKGEMGGVIKYKPTGTYFWVI